MDLLQALHALWQLRIINDSRLSGRLDEGAGFVHAVQVGGAAQVFARIFRVNPSEVHSDVAEIVDWSEAILCKAKNINLCMCEMIFKYY